VKVRGEAHPFDPKYDEYFRDLRKRRVMNTLLAGKKLKDLWLEQGGLCPGCQQPIDLSRDVWHRHHLQRRKEGGSDEAYNLVLLHQTCHHQVHVRRKTVKKPDPRSGRKPSPKSASSCRTSSVRTSTSTPQTSTRPQLDLALGSHDEIPRWIFGKA
jgi:5-methylcytosine-specific restriction endonuclease McrA